MSATGVFGDVSGEGTNVNVTYDFIFVSVLFYECIFLSLFQVFDVFCLSEHFTRISIQNGNVTRMWIALLYAVVR